MCDTDTVNVINLMVVTCYTSVSHDSVLMVPFLAVRRYASAGNSDRNVSVGPSVHLSVRHEPVLC